MFVIGAFYGFEAINMIYRAKNYSQDALAMHWLCGKFHSLPSFDIKTKEAIKADFTQTNNYFFNGRSTSNNCSAIIYPRHKHDKYKAMYVRVHSNFEFQVVGHSN